MSKKLYEFLPDFMIEVEKQLKEDENRHGDKWKELPRDGQVERIYKRFYEYQYQFASKGTPIPWLKIAGLALIGWLRDTYAERSKEEGSKK